MLGFTSPAWLAALGVLAIPVLLHLWSRRPGQRVRLGSLRHLQGAPGPRAWGRRLDDLPLLALRLAALAACVLGLAGLTWRRPSPPRAQPASVILALPTTVADSAGFFADPLVDSLRRVGVAIHGLTAGFPLIEAVAAGQAAPTEGSRTGAWSLLAALADSIPPGSDILVLGDPSAGDLGPRRPKTASSVRWRSIEARAISAAAMRWAGTNDTVLLLERREGTNLLRWLSPPPGGDETGEPAGTPPLLTSRSVTVPAVYLVSDEQVSDELVALQAGITAAFHAGVGLDPVISTIPSSAASELEPGPKLIIWLSGQSVSEAVQRAVAGDAILLEFPSAGVSHPASRSVHATSAIWWTAAEGVQAERAVDSLRGPGVLMVDDLGLPFLTVEGVGQGQWYRIATRPNPAWGNLATGAALPELIFALLTQDHPVLTRSPISPGQAAGSPAPAAATQPRQTSLRSLMLLLTALLVSGERIAAGRAGGRRP